MADLDYIPKMECKLSKLYEIMIEKKKWWEAMGDGEECLNKKKRFNENMLHVIGTADWKKYAKNVIDFRGKNHKSAKKGSNCVPLRLHRTHDHRTQSFLKQKRPIYSSPLWTDLFNWLLVMLVCLAVFESPFGFPIQIYALVSCGE